MMTPTHLFDQSVSVIRPTIAVDAIGAPTYTYGTTASSVVACRVQVQSANENVRAGRPAASKTYSVYCDPASDILSADRLTWGTKTLKILEPLRDFDGQGRLGKLVVIEETP